jgi:hypothetical protein
MSEQAPPAQLMFSLGRLVRGLSALFWGMPAALVVCVQTARTGFFEPFGILPPMMATGVLYYAVAQLGYFRQNERVWRVALDRTRTAALMSLGLSPFLYWWKMMPEVTHYKIATFLMALSGFAFLLLLNHALQRLVAMLPDETLRIEAKLFTTLNIWLLAALAVLATGWAMFAYTYRASFLPPLFLAALSRAGIFMLLLLLLLPLALTMTLIWRIKELILSSVFSAKS